MGAQLSPDLRLRFTEAQAAADTRYVAYGEIASGGMASVCYGRLIGSRGFSRAVAIKRLHAQFAKEPEFVTMFVDEARLSARLLHANIIHTLDVIELPEEVALVMEYVHGESLWSLLRLARAQGNAIPLRVACSLVSSVLHGLHAAHETRGDAGELLELVHRDVSPQNVLVGSDGIPRLLDFGIAKAFGRLRSTPHGEIKGKLGYIACEQLHGKKVDRRTDVYGASAVLWETVAGAPLFDGASEPEIVHRVLYEPVAPPSSQRSEVPVGLDAIVLRGLHRDPTQRFPSALEMALAIEREMGLATQSEVAAWLTGLAGDQLAARAQAITDMLEWGSGANRSQPQALAAGTRRLLPNHARPAAGEVTVLAPLPAVMPSMRRPRLERVVWVLSGVAALGSVISLLATADRPEAATTRTVNPVSQLAATAPQPTTAAPERVLPPLAATLPAAVEQPQSPTVETQSSATPPALPRSSKRRGEITAKPDRLQPATKNPCALYYYLDDRGIRRPKPECL